MTIYKVTHREIEPFGEINFVERARYYVRRENAIAYAEHESKRLGYIVKDVEDREVNPVEAIFESEKDIEGATRRWFAVFEIETKDQTWK